MSESALQLWISSPNVILIIMAILTETTQKKFKKPLHTKERWTTKCLNTVNICAKILSQNQNRTLPGLFGSSIVGPG
jgi:hypothetical protein